MKRSKSQRRKIAKLRSCIFDGKPWSIMPSAINTIVDAVNVHDLDAASNALSFGREVETSTKMINGVAVIPVTGVLRDEVDWMVRYGYASSYQQIEREVRQAVANPQIKGVLFYFDTPGGSAIGVKRVADTIHSLRDKKPINGYVQGMCGSAGFYLMSACSRSEATADALVGSIGTIYPHMEQAGWLEDVGLGVTVVTNDRSPKKGHGNQYEPLTDEAKKTLQGFVNSYGEGFIGDVAKYRGVTAQQVAEQFGQGDAFRADIAIERGMIDGIVANFQESLESISGVSSGADPVTETDQDETPVVTGTTLGRTEMKVSKKVRAQLFALGLIGDMDCTDETCLAALGAWFGARGEGTPSDDAQIIAGLTASTATVGATAVASQSDANDSQPTQVQQPAQSTAQAQHPASNVQQAHEAEMGEARLADLRAAAALVNAGAGRDVVTDRMILDAFEQKLDATAAMESWNKTLAQDEPAIPTDRVQVTGEGSDQFANDVVDALVYRATDNPSMELSEGAAALVNRPLWAVAGECLRISGANVDMYGSRELLAEEAMQMGNATHRATFFSGNEDRRYVQAAGLPTARPGDFPNILSSLANKFLDTIQLDDDYSYAQVSAVLPGGLNDFKPALMINKGIVEELDELQDAEKFKDLGVDEEVLSYIFLRRFGNRFGWTPVLVANDDMNAFAEGMIGLAEAWQVTQNRLVLDRYTSNETLLDGNPLFANRPDTGTGANPAKNDNVQSGGGAPSDSQWGAMETKYADIGGINTGRRVRGSLNVCFTPTGARAQEARRTFLPLNSGGREAKVANTTAQVGLYRGEVQVVPESELRTTSATTWFGLRNPTRLNTATVVRAYFNGFGTAGRRERWYDPSTKTTYVSLEGRIAVAVKNWRYAVRNEE